MSRTLRRAYMVVGLAVWIGSFLPGVPIWLTLTGAITFASGYLSREREE